MFSHIKTLVRRINNHCILKQPGILQILKNPADIAIYRMNYPKVITHILTILPFSERFSRQIRFLKICNHSVIMLIPCNPLLRCHKIVHISARLFKSSGMNFILLIGQFQIIHQIHIFNNTHFLLCRSLTSLISIIKVIGQLKLSVTEKF